MRNRYGWIALALLLVGGAASADWLVLHDGTRMETDGPWTVKGRLVVFTGADGALASLRASEIDLAASEEATKAAEEDAATVAWARDQVVVKEPQQPTPKPILVLTDADVTHVDPDEQDDATAEVEEEKNLKVVSWEQESPDGQDGVIVTGILRNDGPGVASSIKILVQVLNPEGEVLGTQEAQLSSSLLNTGEVLNFRALFSDVQGFDTARFDITNRSFKPTPLVGASAAPPEDEDPS